MSYNNYVFLIDETPSDHLLLFIAIKNKVTSALHKVLKSPKADTFH